MEKHNPRSRGWAGQSILSIIGWAFETGLGGILKPNVSLMFFGGEL